MVEAPNQRWGILVLGGGAVTALVTGFIGWTQVDPDLTVAERAYRTLSLLVLSFATPADSQVPLVLEIARFTAAAVAFGAVAEILGSLFSRLLAFFRARITKRHAVIVGRSRMVTKLALGYKGIATRVVVVAALSEPERQQLTQNRVVAVPPASGQALTNVLHGAGSIVVADENDRATAVRAQEVQECLPPGAPNPLVVFEQPSITQFWNGYNDRRAVCTLTQVAIAVLRQNPPRLPDRMTPPPIVIGDGRMAAEIVRRAILGWRDQGEQTIHCLGPDDAWLQPVYQELADVARVVHSPITTSIPCTTDLVEKLCASWQRPRPDRATVAGPTIIVVLDDDAWGFPLAAALAKNQPDARVSVIVDDEKPWQSTSPNLTVFDALAERSNPATLQRLPEDLLAEEILLDARATPAGVQSLWGRVHGGVRPELGEQEPETARRIRAVAAACREILTAGNYVLTDFLPSAEDALPNPDDLLAMQAALLDVDDLSTTMDGHDALILAARFQTLASRAGWSPRHVPSDTVMTMGQARQLAVQAHSGYRRLAEATGNATHSEAASQVWDSLSDFDREQNLAQVLHYPVHLAELGLNWRRSDNPRPLEFTDGQVELLAEYEHQRWEAHNRRNGRPGHEWAVPWADLPDEVRQYDRDPMRAMPTALADLGIEIYSDAS